MSKVVQNTTGTTITKTSHRQIRNSCSQFTPRLQVVHVKREWRLPEVMSVFFSSISVSPVGSFVWLPVKNQGHGCLFTSNKWKILLVLLVC